MRADVTNRARIAWELGALRQAYGSRNGADGAAALLVWRPLGVSMLITLVLLLPNNA